MRSIGVRAGNGTRRVWEKLRHLARSAVTALGVRREAKVPATAVAWCAEEFVACIVMARHSLRIDLHLEQVSRTLACLRAGVAAALPTVTTAVVRSIGVRAGNGTRRVWEKLRHLARPAIAALSVRREAKVPTTAIACCAEENTA